jgi:hypothetical protein
MSAGSAVRGLPQKAQSALKSWPADELWGTERHFATVAEFANALREFRRRYNEQWLIERHGFRTPAQARASHIRSPGIPGDRPLHREAG